jgi:hypothetical protein
MRPLQMIPVVIIKGYQAGRKIEIYGVKPA